MSSTTDHQLPGLQAQAERVAEEFTCNPEAIQRVTRHFVQKLRDGLMKECAWQLPSFVRRVPTGNEKGSFLAVDLGGTNCRISLVDLHGDSNFTLSQRRHPVPLEVMVCKNYKPLFDFIAEKIDSFLTEKSPSKTYYLGFTFSFTCKQTSLASGTLVHWDKGWDIPEAVGKDPCIMLQEAIDQRGLSVLVTVLANDSVGTLLTRSYIAGGRSSTLASVIFGTGTNAAYIEKVSKIKRLGYTEETDDQIMVMNTEWGCLDDDMEVLPRTSYDDDLDRESPDPGSQMFEKRVSGMYLGEILRRILVQLVHQNAFEMTVDEQSPIFQQHSIDGSFLSLLATNEDKNCRGCLELVESNLLARNATISDVKAIKLLSAAIVRRAARLAGASLSAIIIQSGRLEATRMSTKYPDIEIAKDDVLTPAMAPSSGIKRFRHNLGVLWRRIILLLSSLTGIFKTHYRNNNYHIHGTTEHCVSAESIIDIGADGSLFELYPTFEADMREAMREVPEIGIDGEKRIRLGLAKDGSGMGAALMAQAALETGTTK